jgi:murein L,D-transpeptidase YcbB/YkuD
MSAKLMRPGAMLIAIAFTLSTLTAQPVAAKITPFKQGVAEAAGENRDLAEFYRETDYAPLWTGTDALSTARRAALLRALEDAGLHGLPGGRYDLSGLETRLQSATSSRALGQLEVEMSTLFLQYARDIQTGILTPREVDDGIVRKIPYRDQAVLIRDFAKASPASFMRTLPPQTPEYARLMKEKLRLERLIANGGWGEAVGVSKLEPGASGAPVVQLRNRMMAMGYLGRTSTQSYDRKMRLAVTRFQEDHGLVADGVAGQGTLRAINTSAETRLGQVLVAMERERWINKPLGKRHVWVNITDFHARIVDDGKVTFQTRSVVGHRDLDRRTPEFSDVMEHLVINPTWNVPRSIATKEYLPLLQQNPYAVSHLQLVDRRGRIISRERIEDFNQFDERTFPFNMKQPPSRSNALGLVKFMFPNRYNIYLHDTPQKALFGRETRAFSHGCVRLNDPFDFAYALLAVQEDDPKGFFQARLGSGRETQVDLNDHVPVHLVYRTAFTQAKGKMQFRQDVYGRDAKIWQALKRAGVSLGDVQG